MNHNLMKMMNLVCELPAVLELQSAVTKESKVLWDVPVYMPGNTMQLFSVSLQSLPRPLGEPTFQWVIYEVVNRSTMELREFDRPHTQFDTACEAAQAALEISYRLATAQYIDEDNN